MIQKFVEAWDARKGEIEAKFRAKRPDDYADIVKAVISILGDDFDHPDPERITSIDHGGYQGTLLFVIAASGYESSDFWFVKVSYGSCSGCDTLQAIQGWGDDISDQEVQDYMTLALHILQGIKSMNSEIV